MNSNQQIFIHVDVTCIFSFGWFNGLWILYAEVSEHFISSMEMEERECSETLAYKIQMPGNYRKNRTFRTRRIL